jgi:hypothetical protein
MGWDGMGWDVDWTGGDTRMGKEGWKGEGGMAWAGGGVRWLVEEEERVEVWLDG